MDPQLERAINLLSKARPPEELRNELLKDDGILIRPELNSQANQAIIGEIAKILVGQLSKSSNPNEFEDRLVVDWKRARVLVEHENHLINHRITWLIIITGVLFTLFGTLLVQQRQSLGRKGERSLTITASWQQLTNLIPALGTGQTSLLLTNLSQGIISNSSPLVFQVDAIPISDLDASGTKPDRDWGLVQMPLLMLLVAIVGIVFCHIVSKGLQAAALQMTNIEEWWFSRIPPVEGREKNDLIARGIVGKSGYEDICIPPLHLPLKLWKKPHFLSQVKDLPLWFTFFWLLLLGMALKLFWSCFEKGSQQKALVVFAYSAVVALTLGGWVWALILQYKRKKPETPG